MYDMALSYVSLHAKPEETFKNFNSTSESLFN